MSVVAVMFGRRGSVGMPGKNTTQIFGRPACAYPLMAAKACPGIERIFVSTDDPAIVAVGQRQGAEIIHRPEELATKDAPLEHAIAHAFEYIQGQVPDVSAVVILQANAPCIIARALHEGLELLRRRPDLDSAITGSELSQYGPERARRYEGDVLVPVQPGGASFHRASDVIFGDGGATIVRASVLARMEQQPGPFRFQGARVGLVLQEPCPGDIDQPWQVPAAEWWLSQAGFSRHRNPYRRRVVGPTASASARMGLPMSVQGQRVAIIGRAPYLAESGKGPEIDGADRVVRVNWNLPFPSALHPHVGTRTDILYLMPSASRTSRERSARRSGTPVRIVDMVFRESLVSRAIEKLGHAKVYQHYIPNSGTVAIFDALRGDALEVRAYGFDFHTSDKWVDVNIEHHGRDRWAKARSRGMMKTHDPEVDKVLLRDLLDEDPRFIPDPHFRSILEAT